MSNYLDDYVGVQDRLKAFMQQHIYPNEQRFHDEVENNRRQGNPWIPTRTIEELKPLARAAGPTARRS